MARGVHLSSSTVFQKIVNSWGGAYAYLSRADCKKNLLFHQPLKVDSNISCIFRVLQVDHLIYFQSLFKDVFFGAVSRRRSGECC